MPLSNVGYLIHAGQSLPLTIRCEQFDDVGALNLVPLGAKHVIKLNPEMAEPLLPEGIELHQKYLAQWRPTADWCRATVEWWKTLVGPVLIHCTHGRDRTGLLCAAIRVLAHEWTADKALEEFRAYGSTNHLAETIIEWADTRIEDVIRSLA